jgi:hypothetical protein
MADVQIQQTPGDRGSSNVVWAVVVLVLVALVAWFVFAGGSRGRRSSDGGASTPAGAPAGGTGAGAGAGTTPPSTPP